MRQEVPDYHFKNKMIFAFGKCSFKNKIRNQIWCPCNSFEYKKGFCCCLFIERKP